MEGLVSDGQGARATENGLTPIKRSRQCSKALAPLMRAFAHPQSTPNFIRRSNQPCVCGFVWDGNPDAPDNNCSITAVDPVTRVVTVSVCVIPVGGVEL